MLLFGIISATIIFIFEKILVKDKNLVLKKLLFQFLITFISIVISWKIILLIISFAETRCHFYIMMTPLKFQLYYLTQYPLRLEVYRLLVSFSIAFLRLFFIVMNYQILSSVNQKDVEIARLKELKNQAELQTLHSRINPHFLYNALNSIAGLAYTDAGKTSKMAVSLSELFRYSINKESNTYVAVSDEIEMAEKYLEVEKERFTDRLEYSIEANDNVLKLKIPKFTIQPLVENAIKHGIAKVKTKGIVRIEVKNENNTLIIRIHDNGPDFPDSLIGGYGLQNLHEILQILYSGKASIQWENGENKNIQITLPENNETK